MGTSTPSSEPPRDFAAELRASTARADVSIAAANGSDNSALAAQLAKTRTSHDQVLSPKNLPYLDGAEYRTTMGK